MGRPGRHRRTAIQKNVKTNKKIEQETLGTPPFWPLNEFCKICLTFNLAEALPLRSVGTFTIFGPDSRGQLILIRNKAILALPAAKV